MVAVTAWPGLAQAADTTTGARNLGDFEAVQTQGPTLRVRQGVVASVGVTAERNLLPLLETEVPPALSTRVEGSGDIRAEGLVADTVDVGIVGSGSVTRR